MKNNYLVQAWLVLTLAMGFGAALAGVEVTLAEKIAANKLHETIGQIPSLVPGASSGETMQIAGRVVYRTTNDEGKHVGWVVPGIGGGFADQIEVLIGLDAEADKITGLYILSQKETPGLGSKITEPAWLEQFSGKSTDTPVAVKRGESISGSDVQSITGATISSDSVATIVNDTIAELRDKLAKAGR